MKLKLLLTTTILAAGIGAAHAQDTPPAPADKDTTVVVTGQKKAVRKKLDKTVYNAADNPKADSGTAQDVLQSTPTVSVNSNGDIAINGNANVTVLVNGKPSAIMSGENRAIALQTMAGSDIASVEVITNPSAAYNANGGAILNIVLKKDRKPGGHGAFRANASDQGLWNLNLSGDYTRGKLSLHGSAAVRRDGTLKFRQSDVAWRDPLSDRSGENLQSSEVFIRRIVQTASAGIDYDLNDFDSLSASASYNFRRSRPYFDEFHQDYDAGRLSHTYHRMSNGPNQQSDDSFGLNYNHQKNDTLFKAGLQHSDTVNLVDKSYSSVFLYPVQAPDYGRVLNRTARHLDQATLDYARPVGVTAQLSLGLDWQRDRNAIDNYLATVDPATGAETIDTRITHTYDVTQTQAAAYVTGQITVAQRWEALLGLRFEAVTTRLETAGGAAINGADYHSLNPSLHVKYSFDDERSLTLSYRQSLQRPDPHDLDPYVTYIDAQNISTGDPALRPQSVKSLELTYNADRTGLGRSLGVFYRRSTDTVIEARRLTDDAIMLTTRLNGGSGLSTGLSGALTWDMTERWRLGADTSLYYVELGTIDIDGTVRQSGASWYANLSLNYSQGVNDVSLDAHSEGAAITPQGWHSATNAVNIVWKRKLSPKLTLNLSASDILDGAKESYTVHTRTFDQQGYNHFVARRIYVGLVYRLGG